MLGTEAGDIDIFNCSTGAAILSILRHLAAAWENMPT